MQMQWPVALEPMPQQFTGSLSGEGDYFNQGQNYTPGPFGSGDPDSISRFFDRAGSMDGDGMPSDAMSWFGSWAQQAGSSISNWFNGSPNCESEQFFGSATGGSTGDPHISFNGTTWNDMQSEPDLLHSDSIRGGYQLSTQTTQPNANGVTYNQCATVTTHDGRTQISLNNNGNATITQDGVTQNLAQGQTVQLGNETVTCNQNGSLQITTQGEGGGQITTTMTQNGQGVDVNVRANNVDLGGAMVNGSSNCANNQDPISNPISAPNRPVMRRYEDMSRLI